MFFIIILGFTIAAFAFYANTELGRQLFLGRPGGRFLVAAHLGSWIGWWIGRSLLQFPLGELLGSLIGSALLGAIAADTRT